LFLLFLFPDVRVLTCSQYGWSDPEAALIPEKWIRYGDIVVLFVATPSHPSNNSQQQFLDSGESNNMTQQLNPIPFHASTDTTTNSNSNSISNAANLPPNDTTTTPTTTTHPVSTSLHSISSPLLSIRRPSDVLEAFNVTGVCTGLRSILLHWYRSFYLFFSFFVVFLLVFWFLGFFVLRDFSHSGSGSIEGELRVPQMEDFTPGQSSETIHTENNVKYCVWLAAAAAASFSSFSSSASFASSASSASASSSSSSSSSSFSFSFCNELTLQFDVKKIMFSPGNGIERIRMAKLKIAKSPEDKRKEIIVDMVNYLAFCFVLFFVLFCFCLCCRLLLN
jgi:hypothetical protein